jgi:hypothetical protein
LRKQFALENVLVKFYIDTTKGFINFVNVVVVVVGGPQGEKKTTTPTN